MNRFLLSTALVAVAVIAAPAQATILLPNTENIPFSPFNPATQGAQLDFIEDSGTSFTFSGILRTAVYRNTAGTLDFYYQVERTGPGSIEDQEITGFTASNFGGFTVDALVWGMDPDQGGAFTAAMNNQFDGPLSTTTTGRSESGEVLQTDFGANGLLGTEISATYIFRTNAVDFERGTYGVINGSTLQGFAFQPTGAPIPEPATWAMMIGGFGLIGGAMRVRARKVHYVTA